jgi:hypothetical protein
VSYQYYDTTHRVVPTSGLAVGGFVLALIGISPAALWMSVAAMKHTRSGARGGHGFAVAGAIIGGLGTLVWVFAVVMMLGVGMAASSLMTS